MTFCIYTEYGQNVCQLIKYINKLQVNIAVNRTKVTIKILLGSAVTELKPCKVGYLYVTLSHIFVVHICPKIMKIA